MDGTDFRIQEPSPFSTSWYSQKFRGAGLRYEVGIAIQTSDIVCTNSPIWPGIWNDLQIFRYELRDIISPGERVEADDGYQGDSKVDLPYDFVARDPRQRGREARVWSRHETCNQRFKHFGIIIQN